MDWQIAQFSVTIGGGITVVDESAGELHRPNPVRQ